ncbi:MAG TPA: ABC transporter ATP-binding protein [Caldilineae bacterium]|nr:ABC transporter ATP-binding protein [Caldilineae bacterium]
MSEATGETAPRDYVLRAEGLTKVYNGGQGHVLALDDVSLQVCPGEFVCVVGASGCGKTTLLRVLGGLVPPTRGRILLGGEPVTAPRRRIGFVFQRANLMPWRTVLRNVTLPLEIAGVSRAEAEERARAWIRLVGLEGYERAYPRQLSGGMQQRVVLARALIHDPTLLLLDEPFGALDALTRERMNLELLRIWAVRRPTVVMVTHSIPEAVFLADRVLVMTGPPGRISHEIQVDLERPRTLQMMYDERFAALARRVRQAIGTLVNDGVGPE